MELHCIGGIGEVGASCLVVAAGGQRVLGAAIALLETPEGMVLVSGDVSLAPQHTVNPASPPRRHVDVLVLERHVRQPAACQSCRRKGPPAGDHPGASSGRTSSPGCRRN